MIVLTDGHRTDAHIIALKRNYRIGEMMKRAPNKTVADSFKVYLTYRRRKYSWHVLVFDRHRDYMQFVEDKKKETRALTWVNTKINKNCFLGNICYSRRWLSPQLVVHEAFHAVISVWRYLLRQTRMNATQEEYLAEMIEHLTYKMMKKIKYTL